VSAPDVYSGHGAAVLAPGSGSEAGLRSRLRPRLHLSKSHRQALAFGLLGWALFCLAWYLAVDVFGFWRFRFLPKLTVVVSELFSSNPRHGISLLTPELYDHIWVSLLRVYAAFTLAVAIGAPVGILLGWSPLLRNLFFPVVEMLRPIPPLAWVPLAVLTLSGTELPVVFVTMLAALFATLLNTYLGVRSIDEVYFRAAACLGYSRWQVLRRVVVPGALPTIFTGLEIAMGVSWFSLVGGELIAGKSGLGYLIFDAYTQIALPNIAIGMMVLGLLGYGSSMLIRALGARLTAWRGQRTGEAG
jgi:NitT/TauT family transport system permease protein